MHRVQRYTKKANSFVEYIFNRDDHNEVVMDAMMKERIIASIASFSIATMAVKSYLKFIVCPLASISL